MRTLCLSLVFASLAACTSVKVAHTGPYTAPPTYSGLDCAALRIEAVKISGRVHQILAADNTGRRSPAARDKGLASPWIATFYVADGPGKDELVRLNDSYRALGDVALGAECPVAGEMLVGF